MGKINIEEININKLKMAIYNPRKDLISVDEEYCKIKISIMEFGLVEPFVVNKVKKEYVLISGHQRLKIVKELGYEMVPCIVVKLTKTKEVALNLALNKIANEWDGEKLVDLINEFDTQNIDYMITGFVERDLRAFMNKYNVDINEILENEDKSEEEIICPRCKRNILEEE